MNSPVAIGDSVVVGAVVVGVVDVGVVDVGALVILGSTNPAADADVLGLLGVYADLANIKTAIPRANRQAESIITDRTRSALR